MNKLRMNPNIGRFIVDGLLLGLLFSLLALPFSSFGLFSYSKDGGSNTGTVAGTSTVNPSFDTENDAPVKGSARTLSTKDKNSTLTSSSSIPLFDSDLVSDVDSEESTESSDSLSPAGN